ncbi:hypothetical protein PG996_012264 [Apiospora saccharicola]|uniref:Major facilitator superfamily (MFS) profile domain-containing protein n=1 Tax=Apiospora saccharicola TaxID=335842 RepID=A0ABR1U230_9PEZI
MSYAMEDLGWKFYFVNAAWDVLFGAVVYFTFPETKGLRLEEIAGLFEGPGVTEAACVTNEPVVNYNVQNRNPQRKEKWSRSEALTDHV